ncbi:MAG: hypothetical protein JW724_01425 [Candidatus Altiarchaeota archaeon]|nr:hypothetical protein [Candidatus Altiarchaeota archaeon]
MALFDGLLGLRELKEKITGIESRIEALEALIEPDYDSLLEGEEKVYGFLEEPLTTQEVALRTGKSRSWASLILNRLERTGTVREAGRKGKELLYERVA